MSSLFRTFLAVATLTILSACGLTKGKEIATKSVETFRQQFSESKFAEIYSAATPAFKASVNEANFTKFPRRSNANSALTRAALKAAGR